MVISFATVLGRQGDQMRPLFVSSKTTNIDLLYEKSEDKNATKSASPFEYSSSKFTASNIIQSQSQSAEIFSLEASLQLTEGGVCTTHNVNLNVQGEPVFSIGEHVQGEYMQGEYLQGEYVQGEHVQGEHVQGEYMQGEYMQGEYVQGEYVQGEYVQGQHV